MEENQTQPPQPPVENHEQVKSEQKSFNLKNKWPFLVIAVLLVLVGIFGGYFVMSQTKQSQTPAASPTPTTPQDQTGNPNLTPGEPKETKVMKTYVSQKLKDIGFSGYTLKHGEDWTETSERDDSVGTAKLTLTKNKYSITIQQGPMGGSLCIYKDADLPSGFEGPTSDKRGKAYTDIKTSFGSLRRNEESGGIGENGFSFCQKNDQDGSYGSFTSVGAMGYMGPATFDPAIFSEMDDIIKSIKEL